MDRSEDQLVAAIRKVLSGDAPGVILGPGDDAAIVEPGRHHAILTTDLLLEGVHFEIEDSSPHDLGHRALVVNVSDVAAMGGSPRFALAAVGLSPDVEAAWVMELYGGMRRAADEYAMAVVGGDTNRSDRTVIAVSVYGEVSKGKAVSRSGARRGDRLVVTGSLGASAGGLRIARDPQARAALSTEWGRDLLSRHERPHARVGEGQTLAQAGAAAMMDLSDGLALDLDRLCRESEVGARLWLDKVPVASGLAELGELVPLDPLDLALHGGEDFELLAALPPEAVGSARDKLGERFGTGLTEVGEVTEGGLMAVDEQGERPLEPRGWDHFAQD
jgi:thiamine-monophosphate kinase